MTTAGTPVSVGGGLTLFGVGGSVNANYVPHSSQGTVATEPDTDLMTPTCANALVVSLKTWCRSKLTLTGASTGLAKATGKAGALVIFTAKSENEEPE